MCIIEINILNKGINLSEIGVNNYAYSWEYVHEVLEELEKLKVIILGGDVYSENNDRLILTFDNWYYNLLDEASDSVHSIDKAKAYITNYLSKNGNNYYFSFILKRSS